LWRIWALNDDYFYKKQSAKNKQPYATPISSQ